MKLIFTLHPYLYRNSMKCIIAILLFFTNPISTAKASLCNLIFQKHDKLVTLLESIQQNPALLEPADRIETLFKKTLGFEVSRRDIAVYIRKDFSLFPFEFIADKISPTPLSIALNQLFLEARLKSSLSSNLLQKQEQLFDFFNTLHKLAYRPDNDYQLVEVISKDRQHTIPFQKIYSHFNPDYQGFSFQFLKNIHEKLTPFINTNVVTKSRLNTEIRLAAKQELHFHHFKILDYSSIVDLDYFIQFAQIINSTQTIPALVLLYTPHDPHSEILLKAMDKLAFALKGKVRFGKINLTNTHLAFTRTAQTPTELWFYSRSKDETHNTNPTGKIDSQTPNFFIDFAGIDDENAQRSILNLIEIHRK